jgi:hypothetical protein
VRCCWAQVWLPCLLVQACLLDHQHEWLHWTLPSAAACAAKHEAGCDALPRCGQQLPAPPPHTCRQSLMPWPRRCPAAGTATE